MKKQTLVVYILAIILLTVLVGLMSVKGVFGCRIKSGAVLSSCSGSMFGAVRLLAPSLITLVLGVTVGIIKSRQK
jgi:hypothetical protein